MIIEKNIETLMRQLTGLGFPQSLEGELRLSICFQPAQFFLLHKQDRDGDRLTFQIRLQKIDASDEYRCSFYEAFLRKKIEIPPGLISDIDVKELETRMGSIQWDNLKGEQDTTLVNLESIVLDLNQLGAIVEGSMIANLLKLKFWAETPLESYCYGLNSLKNSYELAQRFYFFEGEEQITVDEAYRFLCHRWRERQLHTRKKGTESLPGTINTDKEPRATPKTQFRKKVSKSPKPGSVKK
jgi:hypothetical protein